MSFQGPRSQYENLHQSSRALLPVRAGRDISDADKSAKKIHLWSPYLTSVGEPAIGPQYLRIYPAAIRACQEGHDVRDVLGLPPVP